MGLIRHHAIVVTATYDTRADGGEHGEHWIDRAYRQASIVFPAHLITPPNDQATNSTYSFLVVPDGSKEGWEESDAGDGRRKLFVEWLQSQAYGDGSSPLTWVEVVYGDELGPPAATVLQTDEGVQNADPR